MVRSFPSLLAFLLVWPVACSGNRENIPNLLQACQVAQIHIATFQSQSDRPIAVWTTPEPLVPSQQEIETFLRNNPHFEDDAELPITLAAVDLRDLSAVENCPHLSDWLGSEGILHDDNRIGQLTRQSEWPVAIIAISLPAISDDGATALLYSQEAWAPLAGTRAAVTYKKDSEGRWVLHTTVPLSIS